MWENRTDLHAEDAELPTGVVRAVESRAQVESLAMLHHQRRQLLDVLAPLKALHGAFGMYDDRRSQLLKAIEVRVRMQIVQEGGKPTDDSVKARAAADEQYERFLDDSLDAKISYLKMENQLSELTERISSREAELYFIGKEMGLQR